MGFLNTLLYNVPYAGLDMTMKPIYFEKKLESVFDFLSVLEIEGFPIIFGTLRGSFVQPGADWALKWNLHTEKGWIYIHKKFQAYRTSSFWVIGCSSQLRKWLLIFFI